MSKTEQGYAVAFSTASRNIVTRRMKDLPQNEDKLNVLDDIEHLWTTLVAKRYHYAFRQFVVDGEYDSWTITLMNRKNFAISWKRFGGFPGSANNVLEALQLLYRQITEKESANG